MNQRLSAIGITIFLLLVAVFGYWKWTERYQKITINSTPSSAVTFYESDDNKPLESRTVVLAAPKPGEYKIKRGNYQYVANGGGDYAKRVGSIAVGNKPVALTITLSYSPEKLASLLKIEQPAALQALNKKYPSQMAGYTPSNGKLYDMGQWYGVKLTPKTPNQDTYRVVLHKDGNTWKVMTTPSIILSSPVYPAIPHDILSDIDNF